MPDKKERRGERYRGQLSSTDKREMDDLIQTTGATRQEIDEAIEKVGNNKEKVERYLRDRRIF
jgi:hypothetical protein